MYLKYGFEVALESAEYMTAGVVKWAYTNAYIEIFKKLDLAGFSDEFDKAINICPIDYLLALCGTGSFDVIRLDTVIKTPDGVSTRDYLTQLYGEKVANAIQAGI